MPELYESNVAVALTKEERAALKQYLFDTGMSQKGLMRQLILKLLTEKNTYLLLRIRNQNDRNAGKNLDNLNQ